MILRDQFSKHLIASIKAGLIALVVTLMVGQEAMAAQTLEQMKTNCEELDAYWQHDPPSRKSVSVPNKAGAAICWGYLTAILDLAGSLLQGSDCVGPETKFGPNCQHTLNICVPQSATPSQVLAVFLAYARSHAEQWHEGAGPIFHAVLSTTFPCKGEYLSPR
jgi:Rap1a immunity proteins